MKFWTSAACPAARPNHIGNGWVGPMVPGRGRALVSNLKKQNLEQWCFGQCKQIFLKDI